MSDGAKDKTQGTIDHAKGKAKEAAGKVTDDERLESEGRKDQVKGDARKAAGHVKDAGNKVKEAVHDMADDD